MIAFGCAVTDSEKYETIAGPAIRRVAESDSEIISHQGTGSLFVNYNLLLDIASEMDDLEALVIVHQDTELVDQDVCAKIRKNFADPDVGVIGAAGAIGVRSIAWWEGAVTWASFTHRYPEHGGGELGALSWVDADTPSWAQTGEVDSIDGFLMILSPWVVRNLRFDESLGRFHGYDLDFCLQVREAGKKVVTENIKAVHHHSLELVNAVDLWVEAHVKITEKWEGRMPHIGEGPDDWKERARRAEAEASAARTQAYSAMLHYQALISDYNLMQNSRSWKLTRALRAPGNLLERRRQRRAARKADAAADAKRADAAAAANKADAAPSNS